MMREIKTCPNQEWKQMPTEELDQILQVELRKEYPSEEVVLPILNELEEREQDYPIEKTPEYFASLKKLGEYKTSGQGSKRKTGWIAGVAALAAAICIVIMAMPRTVGAESIFDILFRWTGSVFEFFTTEQDTTNPPVELVFETDHPGLQKLYDKVTEFGVTDPVVPMWLPEGFVLSELKEFFIPNGNGLHVRFEDGSKGVSITYRISTDITAKFEKEDTAIEAYDYADVDHFILDNEKNLSATWTIDGVECLLSADVSREDFYEIIKSIYRGEFA